ncbi:CaiB/BaiF CoA transferase family protein [Cytobacillus praedii]|uniref:CoA transferase n=1 Tax=Cytobacillus praedii TaxID=1742358 RepID=A0A4R1AV43_9BACI|nr:CaiB/BaiF CoA-transferase family protein [Cytobacillus praedii]TCJ01311.1 CoA transferase [Cytobacillus praedii]
MLDGIRIIDFTNYLPGPYATMRLAELGAEVIKIEPVKGDPARELGVKKDDTGIVFLANNRQKKSITLNLKEIEGRERALQLIKTADAVLESFRPGVMKKLGLDYERVITHKDDIVYCSLTGYGNAGTFSHLGGHDINFMAVSGVLSQLKDEYGKLVHPSIQIADYMGGMAASERILAGLVSKRLTGKGSYHCISIAETVASIMGIHLLIEQETGDQTGIKEINGKFVSYAIYETKDLRYVTLGAIETKFWFNFCQALGRDDWMNAHFSKAEMNNPVYMQVSDLFRSRNLAEWIEFGKKVDCCLSPVLEPNELQSFEPFNEKEIIFKTHTGSLSVKMHGDQKQNGASSPSLGEHTEEILSKASE